MMAGVPRVIAAARDVVPALYAGCDGFVELRALPSLHRCFTVSAALLWMRNLAFRSVQDPQQRGFADIYRLFETREAADAAAAGGGR
jgi:hypothetical protein